MKKLCMLLVLLFIGLASGELTESSLSPVESTDVAVSVDGGAPEVIIHSPLNITYNNATPILVNYTVNDITHDSTWYWVDNGMNISTNESFFLDLAEGEYQLRIYANDSLGRINFSEVFFSVNNSIIFCGNNQCDVSESCSSCEVDCGVCPEPPPDDDGGGGGNGGGGGGDSSREVDFEVNPELININIKQGETKREFIEIKNTDRKELIFKIASGLSSELVNLSETRFSLNAGETKRLAIDFTALEDKEPGLFLGEIIVSSEKTVKKVLVSMEITSKEALFDIKIEILEEYLSVFPGEDLFATLTIISLGREGEVDTNVIYQIKDEDGNLILEREEVISVETEEIFSREFLIPSDVEPGDYLLYTSVSYNGDIGSSSQWFEVVLPGERRESNTVWILLIILIIILILYILKKRSKKHHKRRKKSK